VDCTPLDFSKLGFSDLFTDYLKDEERAHQFYNGLSPFKPDSFLRKSSVIAGEDRLGRAEMSELLMHFNAPFEPSGDSIRNILALKEEHTFTIVTGQQMCLFGGPLYTLYKTVSVIALARHLSEQSDLNVVPVFWMADEDHDFEEIRFTKAPGSTHELKTAELSPIRKAEPSAGRLTISDEIEAVKDALASILGHESLVLRETLSLISDWKPGTSWKLAFGKMMMRLFGKYGLILAGSDDAKIKQALAPVLKKAVENPNEVREKLEDQTSLIERSYHGQAAVTESQLFWNDETRGRTKLSFVNGKWEIPVHKEPLSPAEAALYLEQNELWGHLSPNVFLRPVMQEYLLPNLAYVGGGAELAYHGQMKTVFQFFDLEMPLLLPRLSATILELSIKKALKGTGFSLTDFRQPVRELKRDWAGKFSGYGVNEMFEKWSDELNAQFSEREEYIKGLDENLGLSAKSTRVRMEKDLESLRKKMIRSVKIKEDVHMKRIERVSNALFPEGVLQERELGFVYIVALHGTMFIDSLISSAASDPLGFMKSHQIIEP